MRQETIIKTYLQFKELTDEQKQIVVDSWDNNGNLYEHCMQERVATLKVLAKHLNGKLDYSLCCVPDRGEYITIKGELDFQGLWSVVDVEKDCPFTGWYYDHDIIDHLNKYEQTEERLQFALNEYIEAIHEEYESMCTVEYVSEMCSANEYEFDSITLKLV